MNTSYPPAPDPLPSPAFDGHTHLDMLDVPVEEAVAAARSVGIERMITVGCDLPSSTWSMECAQVHQEVYAAVAIHPNEVGGIDDAVLTDIERLTADPRVVAIGETGLDYYRDWADREEQRKSFLAHIEMAKRTGRVLMIHDREAHEDVLRLLAEAGAPDRVVFHCFSGDAEMARACAAAGYHMSFAGNVTFKNAAPLREAAAAAPAELLLVETDAPFLTPEPNRGKPNAPYLVPYTLRCLAEVKGVGVAELAETITATGQRLYGPW